MAEDNATVRLLSYRELMLTLQGLCKEKRSGIMLIRSDSGSTAQLVLDDGVIFDAAFDNIKGHTALTLIKQIQQGKASFLKRLPGSAMREIYASTAEVFQLLIDNAQTAPAQSAITPRPAATLSNVTPTSAVSPSVPASEGLLVAEAYLAAIIGPIARPIYQRYKDALQQADSLDKLNTAIEQITKQVLAFEQQKTFKENIRELIYRYSLTGQSAVLKVFKTVGEEFRLRPMTLSLLISKYAVHGESGTQLLGKLAPQLELSGNLAAIVPLVDVLRFLEKTGRSGFIEVHAKEKRGFFYFDQGVLINAIEEHNGIAVAAAKSGISVAMEILQWQVDYLTFTLTATVKAGISRAIHQTVDILVREIYRSGGSIISGDEGLKYIKSDNTVLSSDALQSAMQDAVKKLRNDYNVDITQQLPHAIKLAESYDLPNAEHIINRILLVRDNSALAWFWFSRVLTNMAAIEFALKKAVFLDSKNSELAEEVKKFTLARKVVKSNFVLRCPFCWTPVAVKDSECAYCEADFFIGQPFFTKVGKANTDILDKAIARYNEVLQHNTGNAANVYAHFYLAMAYLNRKYYQEGLAQFYELISVLPENRTLIEQGSLLSGYMTSAGLLAKPISQQANLNTESQKSRILVVEDSMVTRKVIARTLVANGYEVFEAKDAIEALTDIEARNPDLVLLDIILPGKDGYEILAEIRQKPSLAKTPVIMLTSRDSLFDKIKGKVSDANEYLTKPFKPDELLLVVKKYLK